MFVPVRTFVEEGDAEYCSGTVGAGLLTDEVLEVACSMRTTCSGAETNLNRGKDGRFSTAILTVNEINIAAELDREFAMAHEVLDVYLLDDPGLGGFARGIGVTITDGGVGGGCSVGSLLFGAFGGGGWFFVVVRVVAVVVFVAIVVIVCVVVFFVVVVRGRRGFALPAFAAAVHFILLVVSNFFFFLLFLRCFFGGLGRGTPLPFGGGHGDGNAV
mmetsp:Transcript_16376/g.26746  ORF Transcript_16376/g.26746 Transcript_16376/m.26746 type:complete len:216 (-) Transcript_16376:20-667(-)